MIEITKKSEIISIISSSKSKINLNINSLEVSIDDFCVNFPGEYEKSWILLEVKEYNNNLFYSFMVESNHIVIINNDDFRLDEEILSFFWDVDILIIKWSKQSAKIFENIEAKLVIPYWEGKEVFLSTLWQHSWEVSSYKLKWEFSSEDTEFVNLI